VARPAGQASQLIDRLGESVGDLLRIGYRVAARHHAEVHAAGMAEDGQVERTAVQDWPERMEGLDPRAGRIELRGRPGTFEMMRFTGGRCRSARRSRG